MYDIDPGHIRDLPLLGKGITVTIDHLPQDILARYEIHEWKHACAILKIDCPQEFQDIIEVLDRFVLLRSEVKLPGGGKSRMASRLDKEFYKLGWSKKNFETTVTVDDNKMRSPTHEVDCFKNRVALEVEWSNKDPFYDCGGLRATLRVSTPRGWEIDQILEFTSKAEADTTRSNQRSGCARVISRDWRTWYELKGPDTIGAEKVS